MRKSLALIRRQFAPQSNRTERMQANAS